IKERVAAFLAADGRLLAVAGPDDRLVREREQYGPDRFQQGLHVAAGEIGAADRAGKERVADKERRGLVAIASDREAHAARTVPGGMEHAHLIPSESQRSFAVIKAIDRRLRFDADPEHRALLDDAFVERVVGFVQPDRDAERLFRASDARDVVEMR